ncbi:Est-Q [Drosophila busckii]|uniref:Carboxylic ester hydrolase n=2 Tax=Drosophila busckii TaxID=30019 RepID=A0A0M4ELA5_DROBS|nr:Est-Q [Drosophila busckii]
MRRRGVYVMLSLCGMLCAGFAGWLLVTMSPEVDGAQAMSTLTVALADKQGEVRGNYGQTTWTQQSFMQFRGIPYAEPPVGPLRFRKSVARLPWNETLDVLDYGQRCPVTSNLNEGATDNQLQDCLNLCVYSKNLTDRRPVMFYIHGGGYYNGSSSDHPPHYLMEKDIVLVVPQFRFGALGWMTTYTEEHPGNVAIGDILLALEWVQKHIHVFGGDAARVTIFGQSAGSSVTSAVLLSPRAKPEYFRSAIVQSGSIFASWAVNRDAVGQARRICGNLGCQQCEQHSELDKCVRGASVRQLLEASKSESFSPSIGDQLGILPESPKGLLKNYRGVPVMTGFTKHDGSFALAMYYDEVREKVPSLRSLTVRQFSQGLIDWGKDGTGLTDHLLYRLLYTPELLNSHNHREALPSYFDLANDIFMKSPVMTLAGNFYSRHPATPIYVYNFQHEGQHTRFGYEFGNAHYPFNGGVHHSDDNIYLFSTHRLEGDDVRMAQRMVEVWTSFAITGRPNGLAPLTSPSGPYNRLGLTTSTRPDLLETFTETIDDPNHERLQRRHIEF